MQNASAKTRESVNSDERENEKAKTREESASSCVTSRHRLTFSHLYEKMSDLAGFGRTRRNEEEERRNKSLLLVAWHAKTSKPSTMMGAGEEPFYIFHNWRSLFVTVPSRATPVPSSGRALRHCRCCYDNELTMASRVRFPLDCVYAKNLRPAGCCSLRSCVLLAPSPPALERRRETDFRAGRGQVRLGVLVHYRRLVTFAS